MHAAQSKPCILVPELPWDRWAANSPERTPPTLDLTDGCGGLQLLPADLHTAHRAPVSPEKWVLHQVDELLAPAAEPRGHYGASCRRAFRRRSERMLS